MAKLDKNKWLSTDTYDFVEKKDGLYAIHSECKSSKKSKIVRLFEYVIGFILRLVGNARDNHDF